MKNYNSNRKEPHDSFTHTVIDAAAVRAYIQMENQEGNVRYYSVDNLVKCTLNDNDVYCSNLGYSITDVLDSGLLQHDGTI